MTEDDLHRLTARARRTSPTALRWRVVAAYIVGIVLEIAGAGWGAAIAFGAILGWALIAHVRRELAAGRLVALEHARGIDGRARARRLAG
jgi:hypothetical protein